MQVGKGELTNELKCIVEVVLCFSGEAHHDVCAEGGFWKD